MKKSAFILVETIVVISIFVLVSLLIAGLLVSSYKMTMCAKRKYVLETEKSNFIISLYTGNFDVLAVQYSTASYTQKITVAKNGYGCKIGEKFDVIWKK